VDDRGPGGGGSRYAKYLGTISQHSCVLKTPPLPRQRTVGLYCAILSEYFALLALYARYNPDVHDWGGGLDKGGGWSKKSVFGRTSLMDDPYNQI